MSTTARERVKELLEQAARLPAGQRGDFVRQEARGDEAVLREALALLPGLDDSGFMNAPTVAAELANSTRMQTEMGMPPLSESPGARIGRYKLLQQIGEGGFGMVFMAEQTEPVSRRVALKIIKAGMDTRQVIARFEAERQALALMDHPNIARVFDAGATEAGRPYFVMELVRGEPITKYCDREQLPIERRLQLFADVCRAVQHAHQKGVIHRDIKPTNVLVTVADGQPLPKVIDFGIAKATAAPLTDKTLFTEMHQLIGTPEYMSPEQAEPAAADIDTRSDVYSLGVLLYELLTGTTPFDGQRLKSAGFQGLVRIIREEEPQRPSVRMNECGKQQGGKVGKWEGENGAEVNPSSHFPTFPPSHSTPGSSAFEIARCRRTEPQPLERRLRGDLDWIVMRCLEKDRRRRYETANSLAADVQRHLSGEPVLAAPPSRVYHARKLLWRYRTAAVVIGAVVGTAAVGTAVALMQWQRAESARDAEAAQRARAQAVSEFLKDLLTAADPARAKGAKLTVREALDAAAARLDQEPITDQPLVEAEIRFTIGDTYGTLGLYPQAEGQLRAAEALQTRKLGNEHPVTLRTRTTLAKSLNRQAHFAEAEKLAEATMQIQRRTLGPDHSDTLHSMVIAGVAMSFNGRYADSVAILTAAVEGRRRVLGENHPDTAEALSRLAITYKNTRPEKAEPLAREAVRIQTEALGEDHPDTLTSMMVLGDTLYMQFRADAAEPVYRRLLELSIRALGPEHTETFAARTAVASVLDEQARLHEAVPLYRENLAALVQYMGPAEPQVISLKHYLAGALARQNEHAEAEALLREALDAAREKYGPEHADTSIRLMCSLAELLEQQRKDVEAEQVARQVLEYQRRQTPRADLFEFKQSSYALTRVLKRRGAGEEALNVERELIAFLRAAADEPDASISTLHRVAATFLFTVNDELRDAPRAVELELEVNRRAEYRNPLFVRGLAQAYLRAGDTMRAVQAWEQSFALIVDDRSRAAQLSYAAWELLNVPPPESRDPAAALKFAQRANELTGYENPAYLTNLARAFALDGQTETAVDVWNKLIAILPDDRARANSLNGAAWTLLTGTPETIRNPAVALKLALRAAELSKSENPAILDTLALAYARTGDAAKAVDTQEKAISLLAGDASDRAEYITRLTEYEAAANDSIQSRMP